MKLFLTALTTLIIFCNGVRSQTISMTVDAIQQGKFKGENQRQTDRIDLTAATLEISTATSMGNGVGMATGRRQHQPFVIRKLAGASSPQFLQALISNEMLKKVVIEFSGPNQNEEKGAGYVITLENVRVTSFKQSATVPENTSIKVGTAPSPLMDEIKLIYQKITVECRTGNTMAVDDLTHI
ncbi:MAG: type VI secretion system tube protein Hcp [Flavisolibacter sp.]